MRKPYPSDLTDEQWEIIKPLIPVANRQRIAQLGASFVRHRISPRNVGLNRHFLRGSVAVLSPLRPPGTSPWSVQPRPWSSLVAGVSPGDLLVLPWGLQHRLADALSRGSAQAWEPKCREQPSPPPRNDAMRCRSEVTKPARCAVGKSRAMRCRSAALFDPART